MFRNTLLGWSASQFDGHVEDSCHTPYGDVFAGIVQLAGCDTEVVNAFQDKVLGPSSTKVTEGVQQLLNPMSLRIPLIEKKAPTVM